MILLKFVLVDVLHAGEGDLNLLFYLNEDASIFFNTPLLFTVIPLEKYVVKCKLMYSVISYRKINEIHPSFINYDISILAKYISI